MEENKINERINELVKELNRLLKSEGINYKENCDDSCCDEESCQLQRWCNNYIFFNVLTDEERSEIYKQQILEQERIEKERQDLINKRQEEINLKIKIIENKINNKNNK